MDPEFEFEEIRVTEAERLQRLVRRHAMRLAVQTDARDEAEYLRIARRAVTRQKYWQMLG